MIYETTRVQQNQSLTPQISEDYGKTTAQAKSLGMDDGQTVGFDGKTETAASQTEQAAFENPLLKGKEEKNTEKILTKSEAMITPPSSEIASSINIL